MTPRGTDWSLAALIAALGLSGLLSWDGLAATAWIIPVHDILGLALTGVLVWKLRRVLRRLTRSFVAFAALLLVVGALGTGFAWATFASYGFAGFSLLAWHVALGIALIVAVAVHLGLRARPLRRRDVADRRQALIAGGTLAAGAAVYFTQRPVSRALGLEAGGRRAATGSYPTGDDFPATSWIADDPDPLGADARLAIVGNVAVARDLLIADLGAPDELTATLDCTGGFVTTQRWGGVRLDRLLADAGPRGSHVRIVSVTGYRWFFRLSEAERLLLATTVAGAPLDHGHGAPLRLVAPAHRGWHWVKWVDRVEVVDGPDPGAYLSTLTSSL